MELKRSCELQPPRGRHGQTRDFADDRAQPAMPDAFFHTGEDCLVIAGLDIDDAIRFQARLHQRWGEQVWPGDAPKDLPRVRATTRPANSAAAAPSMAPLPPPAISCSAPSASLPPGSRESSSAIPKGSTDLARRVRSSIFSMCARNTSMAGSGRKMVVDLHESVYKNVLYLFYD